MPIDGNIKDEGFCIKNGNVGKRRREKGKKEAGTEKRSLVEVPGKIKSDGKREKNKEGGKNKRETKT